MQPEGEILQKWRSQKLGKSHHVELRSKLFRINLHFYFQPRLSIWQFINKWETIIFWHKWEELQAILSKMVLKSKQEFWIFSLLQGKLFWEKDGFCLNLSDTFIKIPNSDKSFQKFLLDSIHLKVHISCMTKLMK